MMTNILGWGRGTIAEAQAYNTAENAYHGYPNSQIKTDDSVMWFTHPDGEETDFVWPIFVNSKLENRPGTIYSDADIKTAGWFPDGGT